VSIYLYLDGFILYIYDIPWLISGGATLYIFGDVWIQKPTRTSITGWSSLAARQASRSVSCAIKPENHGRARKMGSAWDSVTREISHNEGGRFKKKHKTVIWYNVGPSYNLVYKPHEYYSYLCIINHSYWSYLHQLSYRSGASRCNNDHMV